MISFIGKKRKKVVYMVLVIFLVSIIPDFASASGPVIEEISPDRGTTAGGTEVTITGSNFSPTRSKVKFGEFFGEVISVKGDGTVITVKTPQYTGQWPEGATEMPVNVTVESDGITDVVHKGFTYTPSTPKIRDVNPKEATAGDEITIDGEQFIDGALVVIGGVDSPKITFVDSTIIKAKVPALASGLKGVRVTNPDRQSVILDDAFFYKKSIPSITKVEPSKGPINTANVVTITGDNFVDGVYQEGNEAGKRITRVFFGDQEAAIVNVLTQQKISVITPEIPVRGKRHVIVDVDGVKTIKENAFEFISNPKITGLEPSSGSVLGGETITIQGSGFLQGANVYFGTKRASNVDVRTDSLISVTAPSYENPGEVDVRVVNPDSGEAVTETYHYTYLQSKPKITEIEPEKGSVLGGTAITIKGEQFMSGIKLYIDGREIENITRISETELKAVAPPNIKEGSKDVKIVNPDRGEYIYRDGFTYTRSKPVIFNINPTKCSTVKQEIITITGENFISGATVKIGNNSATEVRVMLNEETGETTITARVPEGLPGRHDIIITNPDGGQAVRNEGFEYTVSEPVIEKKPVNIDVEELLGDDFQDADLNTGSTYGGTIIEIKGNEFSYSSKIDIGGRVAKIISVAKDFSSNIHTIIAETPPGEIGIKTLTITNPDGSRAVSTFKYIMTPVITGITPNNGYTEGGEKIAVTGTGFNTDPDGVRFFIGGVEAEDVKVESSTRISALTPVNSEGEKDVVIINMNDLGSFKLPKGFKYKLPPSNPIIESIQPGTGPITGGNEVEIIGADLRSGIKVYFGTAEAKVESIRTVDDNGTTKNIIKCTAPPNAAGEADIKVVNPDGNFYIVENGYTYKIAENALTVTSITPSSGLIEGNTFVTIRGANFVTYKPIGQDANGETIYITTNVTIGGNDLKGLIIEDSRKITGYTPGGTLGPQDVIVKVVHVKGLDQNEDGSIEFEEEVLIKESVRLKGGFTYKLPQSHPVIESITPREGPSAGGTTVIIKGQDFEDGAQVYFGDYEDNRNRSPFVEVLNPTEIHASAPATTRIGSRDVYVINPDGGTAVYEDGYIYRGNILIAVSITPNLGTVSGNVYATIKGANFIEGTKVNFGTEAASNVTVIDSETITLSTPANTPGAKDVIVYNMFGEARLKNGFLYYIDQSQPKITGLSPTSGTAAGGERVKIYGSDFRSGASVTFAGVPASDVFVETPNLIHATTPPGIPGTSDVGVMNTDGGSYILEDGFLYISNPIIKNIFPSQGTVNQEIPVTVTGENFDPELKAYVDGQEVPYCKVVNNTTIKIRAPKRGNPGYADITIKNPDGGKSTISNGFRYRIPSTSPEINSIVPDRGSVEGGTVITINGSNFEKDAIVIIGDDLALNIKVENSTFLTARTPPGAEGKKDVFVINLADSGQAVVKDGFEYMNPSSRPTISSVSPNQGTIYGGTDIIITGTDFRAGATVIIGGNKARNVEVISPVKIRVITPPGEHGKKNVTVMNTDAGSATLVSGFEYKAPETEPEIHDVTPAKGSAYGGTFVTIKGKNFVPGARVTFGGEPAPYVLVSDPSTIKVYTPPHTPGEKEVAVTNPDTGLARWDGVFEYVVPDSFPKIETISPNRGTTNGGTYITVKGSDFRKDIKLLIDGNEAEVKKVEDDEGNEVDGITIVSGTHITAVTPPGTPGKKDVIVENEDTGTSLKKEGFEYIQTKTEISIDSIDPNKGTIHGGTPIIIKGDGFIQGAKVFIGGAETKETVVIDEQTIKARTGPNTPGIKNITVQNPDGSSATLEDAFEYRIPTTNPKITFLDPNKGPIYGGIEVAIFGEGFEPGARVFIDRNEADVVFVISGQIKIILPEGTPGLKDVIVINPDTGLAHKEEGFLYLEFPKVISVDPNKGALAGGTKIIITGNYFAQGAKVEIGGKMAQKVQVHSSTTISAETPPGDASGYADVKVINPDGGEGILKDGYYYIAPRTAPLPPEGFSAESYDSITIELTWDPSEHADYYEIFASRTDREDSYKFLERTERTRFFVTDLAPNTKYYFKVRAVNELGSSDFSRSDYAYTDRRRAKDTRYDDRLEGIVSTHEGNAQIFTIHKPSDLKYSSELEIDEDFRRFPKKTIIVTYEAVYDLEKDLVIKTSDLNLTVPRSDLKRYLSSAERDDRDTSGVRIIIEKADKQLAEQMLRSLPRGTKPLTDIYNIRVETQIAKDIKEHTYFSSKLEILYDYETYRNHKKDKIILSYYDYHDDKFIEVSSSKAQYIYGSFNSTIIMPGYYLLTVE